jgi:hypothetical protein
MRPFTDILRDIRKGRVVEALGDELAEVVKSVLENNKAGSITLVLSIKPQGRGDNAIIITPKITSSIARPEQPDGLFFADLDGNLLRDDPTQQRIFSDTAAPIAEAGDRFDPKTGEIIDANTGKPYEINRTGT